MKEMIYLSLDQDELKLLSLKKTFMGQFEVQTFYKKHQTPLLNEQGKISSVDIVASAVKEALSALPPNALNGRELILILPQQSFAYLRSEVPKDIAPSALLAFIKDKVRSTLAIDLDHCLYDYFMEENGGQKQISFYAIDESTWTQYSEVFALLELKISSVLPETLAYYKLFKKTLRKDKRENILYAHYQKDRLKGYLFDSNGLLEATPWLVEFAGKQTIEAAVKEKAEECEKKEIKINRLIVSGEESDTIRQDTFTKEVGIWTNPIKRIIPNFYEDYLKMLVTDNAKPFALLTFDACFGAFVLFQENKNFAFLKQSLKHSSKKTARMPAVSVPFKEIGIFVASFVLAFLAFVGISQTKIPLPKLASFSKPTPSTALQPTPRLPSATPTPSIKRADIKIKVLNGSGAKGKASEVKDVLKKLGYGDILTGNADSFDFTNTEVAVKKTQINLGAVLKKDLKDYTTTIKVTDLSEKEAADAVITFGTDFK